MLQDLTQFTNTTTLLFTLEYNVVANALFPFVFQVFCQRYHIKDIRQSYFRLSSSSFQMSIQSIGWNSDKIQGGMYVSVYAFIFKLPTQDKSRSWLYFHMVITRRTTRTVTIFCAYKNPMRVGLSWAQHNCIELKLIWRHWMYQKKNKFMKRKKQNVDAYSTTSSHIKWTESKNTFDS